eukprot:gb/GEZN01012476.1/.p1 GENE.gb/GEZN01012476.1/~~gb/GEZN01012476.1/.p1  ORF type:complete len:148 (-),score=2.92 gb/GEZN01012476.1/:377-820(-)
MHRAAYRGFAASDSFIINHPVWGRFEAGSPQAATRWHEFQRDAAGKYTQLQEGTLGTDSISRWMGSIGMDKFRNIAIGYSVGSATLPLGIRYQGRLFTDPLGTMGSGEGIIQNGEGVQIACGTEEEGACRDGDYTGMSIDPLDDCTF